MSDEGGGRFTGETIMPDRPWIQVYITVYTDSGYTIEDDEYRNLTQVFHRDDGGSGAGGGSQKDEEITGFVSFSRLEGSLKLDSPLRGSLELSEISGALQDAPGLQGGVDSQSLIGIVECE